MDCRNASHRTHSAIGTQSSSDDLFLVAARASKQGQQDRDCKNYTLRVTTWDVRNRIHDHKVCPRQHRRDHQERIQTDEQHTGQANKLENPCYSIASHGFTVGR